MADRRLVWDSDSGGVPRKQAPERVPTGDGIVRIRREVGGRRGKPVTTIHGLPLSRADLEAVARELKRRAGVGGAVKDGVIELQGDHRDMVEAWLTERGHEVRHDIRSGREEYELSFLLQLRVGSQKGFRPLESCPPFVKCC